MAKIEEEEELPFVVAMIHSATSTSYGAILLDLTLNGNRITYTLYPNDPHGLAPGLRNNLQARLDENSLKLKEAS